MAMRKKTKTVKVRATKIAHKVEAKAGVIRETWNSTLAALASAEEEMQKQLSLLLKRNKITTKDASAALKDFRDRVERERKKALKQIEGRVSTLQARVRKERKAAAKMMDDTVKGALVALNIPSRQEVAELTHKVDELSRKIDGFKAPARRAGVGA